MRTTKKIRLKSRDISEKLFDDGWRTDETYVSSWFEPCPETSCVYILLHTNVDCLSDDFGKERVLYVGQTINLVNRLRNHETRKLIRKNNLYERAWFKPCEKHNLMETEKQLIKKYDPSYNLVHRNRGI